MSAKTGKTVEIRKIGPACIDGCFTRVTMDVVKKLFDKFWALGNYNDQNAYLGKFIKSNPVKRRRVDLNLFDY